MAETLVSLEVENGVATVTLNRPDKRNALTKTMIEQLHHALELAPQEGARVLLLKAEGTVFCAGMDLGEMQQRAQAPNASELWDRDSKIYRDMVVSLFTMEIPTVAVVQGAVVAGGMGMILACDIVLASNEAVFALPEPKRGITAAMVTPLLAYRVGAGIATYLLLSGENVSAHDAHRMGLCHLHSSPTDLQTREDELVSSILTGSPAALSITKRHLHDVSANRVIEQIDASVAVSAKARETEDAQEGLQAFLEKRKPRWSS